MPKKIATISSLDLAGLEQLASALVTHLPDRVVLALVGTLGAGKTALTQAIAKSAGVDTDDVTSPTFTLLQTHHGCITIHHLDAYRVADEDEFLELGFDELLDQPNSWTIVEWADRVSTAMPPETLWMELTIDPEGTRTLTASTDDDAIAQRFRDVEAAIASGDSCS